MMSIVRILLPFVYCVTVGTAYSLVFKRKLIDSLAPAFFLQILLMLLTGITIGRLSVGIWIGFIVALGAIFYFCVREKSLASLSTVFVLPGKFLRVDVCLFVVAYLVIFVFNAGKHFNMSGEFTHWGWFVRESYNNDFLYSISTKAFEHKDYVPGVSLFETLWCRLSLRYSEPNAYRGIQMLQISMLLPVVLGIYNKISENLERKSHKIAMFVVNLFIVLALPLFSAVPFYHTLYMDLILGVLVFYCIWITISEDFDGYSLWLLGLTLSIIMLCKNVGIAFVPALFLFYGAWHHLASDKNVSRIRIWISSFVVAAVSVIPWALYQAFLRAKGVNVAPHYQNDITASYWKAIAMKGIVAHVSYLWIVVALAVLFIIFALIEDNQDNRRKVVLIGLWVFLTGIYYSVIMYFVYKNNIVESEAVEFVGLERYMSTYVLMALYAVVVTYSLYMSAGRKVAPYLAAIFLVENIAVFFGAGQLLPGTLTHDEIWYEGHIEYLNNTLPEGADLLFVSASADVNAGSRVQFYCENIEITEGIFASDSDVDTGLDDGYSVEEFAKECAEHDYIYFFSYEDDFIDRYSDAFEGSDVIALGKLYKVENVNGKIRTSPVE
ncbi:hypothetical protein [Butyrivibrio sp. VCB2006]|uniref:hypothetical protein n=1 Tax=Butyrivibrio sp. VCB2006 TaxID=1280679 RepID=UPI000417F144|nr:hypothetical protein [Butyrivibrio sp. VCB2006]